MDTNLFSRISAAFRNVYDHWEDVWDPDQAPVNAVTGEVYTGIPRIFLGTDHRKWMSTENQAAAYGLAWDPTKETECFNLKQVPGPVKRFMIRSQEKYLAPTTGVTGDGVCIPTFPDLVDRNVLAYVLDGPVIITDEELAQGMSMLVNQVACDYYENVNVRKQPGVTAIAKAFTFHGLGLKTDHDMIKLKTIVDDINHMSIAHDLLSAAQITKAIRDIPDLYIRKSHDD